MPKVAVHGESVTVVGLSIQLMIIRQSITRITEQHRLPVDLKRIYIRIVRKEEIRVRPIKKSRANAGETLVEVVASIFIFLILMGILQGAITYSSNSLKKNKEIRSDNAKIMEALQDTEVTSVERNKNIDFNATNSDMSIKGNHVFSVATDLNKKIVTYTDSKGEEQTTTFYLYGSPDADASQSEEQVHTTPEGGGNS